MNNSSTQIIARPVKAAWAGVAVALLFCIFAALIQIFDPPKSNEVAQMWFLGGVPAIVAVGLLLYVVRHRVIADQNGLRWRGAFTGWKSVRWDEVSDFTISSQSKKSATYEVETARGTLTFGSGNDDSTEELAAFIARSATAAPYREWNAKGLRPAEEFEMTFATPTITWSAILLSLVPLMAINLAILPLWRPRDFALWQAARALDSAEVAPWALVAPFVFLAFLASAFLTAILAPIISMHQKRERVIVTHRGLRFEKNERALEVGWDELRAIHLRNERAHFISARGDWRMHWILVLRSFIEHYAPAAHFDTESDNMDLEQPLQLENGTRFYSFRTTNLRLMLRIFVAMAALYALMPPLMSIGFTPEDAPRDDPRGIWLILPPFTAFCLWLWRLYRRGGIALSENGLGVRGAWRDRFYRWDELEARDDKLMVRGSERQVELWSFSAPIRKAEMRAEIKRRVAQEQPRRVD